MQRKQNLPNTQPATTKKGEEKQGIDFGRAYEVLINAYLRTYTEHANAKTLNKFDITKVKDLKMESAVKGFRRMQNE